MDREYSFISKDNKKIIGYKWLPENRCIGVVQIVHGSVEHALRYKAFGNYMVKNGFAVYIHDQRGHGKTAKELEELSMFSNRENGWELAKEDILYVNEMIKKEYSDLPLFLLGHSMGSFLVRDIISETNNVANGVILTGTTPIDIKNMTLYQCAKVYINFKKKFFGNRYRDKTLHKYIYEDLILTRDDAIVDKYKEDIYCGYTATLEYLSEMFKGMIAISRVENIKNIDRLLPIYVMSGELDKVADQKIKTLYDTYKSVGLKDVELKIYKSAYHEILNETNKIEVYDDILNWINKRTNK